MCVKIFLTLFSLQVDSFLEICRHKAVYRCVIDILSEIAGRLWLARLLWKQPGQKKSIYSLLLAIKDKAQKVLDRLVFLKI